jgi:ABC-type polysaccharide/polyol phosphate export permease
MTATAPLTGWRMATAVISALLARARNELVRVPGAAIPGVLAPTIFFLGLNGVFGNLIKLRGFDASSYSSFIVAVSMLQGAGFTGAATGVNMARDIEAGWFDRLISSPTPRWVLLTGNVVAASVRALIPATSVMLIAFLIGAHWPGLLGLVIALFCVMAMASVAACWSCFLALKYRSQSAAPLMQAGTFTLILMTTAYAPLDLLQGWLKAIASINPVTDVIEAVRQGFIGSVSWSDTWPGLLALAGLLALFAALALRGMNRFSLK